MAIKHSPRASVYLNLNLNMNLFAAPRICGHNIY